MHIYVNTDIEYVHVYNVTAAWRWKSAPVIQKPVKVVC